MPHTELGAWNVAMGQIDMVLDFIGVYLVSGCGNRQHTNSQISKLVL